MYHYEVTFDNETAFMFYNRLEVEGNGFCSL